MGPSLLSHACVVASADCCGRIAVLRAPLPQSMQKVDVESKVGRVCLPASPLGFSLGALFTCCSDLGVLANSFCPCLPIMGLLLWTRLDATRTGRLIPCFFFLLRSSALCGAGSMSWRAPSFCGQGNDPLERSRLFCAWASRL